MSTVVDTRNKIGLITVYLTEEEAGYVGELLEYCLGNEAVHDDELETVENLAAGINSIVGERTDG